MGAVSTAKASVVVTEFLSSFAEKLAVKTAPTKAVPRMALSASTSPVGAVLTANGSAASLIADLAGARVRFASNTMGIVC